MKRVSGVKFWLLGAFTFGIYSIVVWCRMAKNLNTIAEQTGETTICGYFPALLLGCVTCGVVPIVWLFKFFGLASRLNAKLSAGVAPTNPFLMFLMSCIPVYSFFWLATIHNELLDAAGK